MTAEEISLIIQNELKSEPDITNVFGLDLRSGLIPPTKQQYKDSNDVTETYELWTVLEERVDKNGYKIYFDEDTGLFGLSINSDSEALIAIGDYGTFLDTVYSL